jgi:hypothetical protein
VTIYAEALDERVGAEYLKRFGRMAEHAVRLEGGQDNTAALIEAEERAERLAERMATAGPLMLGKLENIAEEIEATYAALRASHDPEVRQVLMPTGRTLADAWDDKSARSRLLADMGLRVTLWPKQRDERLSIEWGTHDPGGDDQELIEWLSEADA